MTNTNTRLLPFVSIVIPVFNGSEYLKDAIDSALNQSYRNCEVIVVNDGSSDANATRSVATSYGRQIRYYEKENGGVATALNLGIMKAQGEYISWLSHDDMYFLDKIERQVAFLSNQENRDVLIYSDFETIDVENNEVLVHFVNHLKPYNYIQDTIMLLLKSSLHGCSFLLPKKCFLDVGFFDKALRTTQDYSMWFRLLKYGYEFKHCPGVVMRARWHEEQGSRAMKSIQCAESENLHMWALNIFFNEIAAFPAKRILDVVLFEKTHQVKCADYLTHRIYREKPLLFLQLTVHKVYHRIKAMTLPMRRCMTGKQTRFSRIGQRK